MTAYGRFSQVTSLGQWQVEVHSVNKKSLECAIFLPKELLCLDIEVRKKVGLFCKRGQVTVRISLSAHPEAIFSKAKISYLSEMRKQMQEACAAITCDPKEITFPFLYENMKENLGSKLQIDEVTAWQELLPCLENALKEYNQRKEVEGGFLEKALIGHLEVLKGLLDAVEQSGKKITEKRRQKILDRLQELTKIQEEEQERILREVFYYVERSDITEEIVRLGSHIQQFRSSLKEDGGIGKSLEFLVQEMGREVNTISSKSDDAETTALTLKMKVEVEKIREQVQNIE